MILYLLGIQLIIATKICNFSKFLIKKNFIYFFKNSFTALTAEFQLLTLTAEYVVQFFGLLELSGYLFTFVL